MGASVDDFHAAANETKKNVSEILKGQTKNMEDIVNKNKSEIEDFITILINELTVVTFVMIVLIIFIAMWMSGYLSQKIRNILIGTEKFSNNELDYRIKVTSDDEIGQLEKSFNEMASKIENLIKEEKDINVILEKRVLAETSKQKEQEQLLIQQTRLAAMGEMIGNIAHQWRQPLNALGLVFQNLKFSYEIGDLNDDMMTRTMNKAEMLTNNMSKTIDDFRNFFRPNKEKEYFDINKNVLSAIDLVESTFEFYNIKLEKYFQEEKIEYYGFPSEFSQVILNIISNAKDALLGNNIENPVVRIETKVEDNKVYISIKDNAIGIDESIINKIFEPYFTTKDEGQGTGIGLYMSKIIVEKNMNGEIYVENTNKGANFIIKFPLKNE
jgi:signal transduction histidine kinase